MPDNSSAYVEDIASLEELRAALLRFQSEAHSAVTNAQREITAALDGLQERLHYWQRQLNKRQEVLAQARDELARCLSLCGPHGERADCSASAAAVKQAEQKVQEAQEAIRTAQVNIKRVEELNARFQRQTHRFNTTLTSTELPKASALLRKSITILESYISQKVPPVGRLASRAARIAVSLGIALGIAGAGAALGSDFTMEIPVPSEPPAASASTESASPIRQGAKLIEEMVDDAHKIEEEKKKIQDEIEKNLQQD